MTKRINSYTDRRIIGGFVKSVLINYDDVKKICVLNKNYSGVFCKHKDNIKTQLFYYKFNIKLKNPDILKNTSAFEGNLINIL